MLTLVLSPDPIVLVGEEAAEEDARSPVTQLTYRHLTGSIRSSGSLIRLQAVGHSLRSEMSGGRLVEYFLVIGVDHESHKASAVPGEGGRATSPVSPLSPLTEHASRG